MIIYVFFSETINPTGTERASAGKQQSAGKKSTDRINRYWFTKHTQPL